MGQPRRVAMLLCILLAGLGGIQPAVAVDIKGRSSTQYLWYNDIVDGSKQAVLAEYLQFSLNNIDSAKKLSLHGYGRITYDLKEQADGSDQYNDRLYFFYADYKDLLDRADIRLGRQFVNLSAGSALIDGVEAEIKNVGPVGFAVMGGRMVLFGEERELTSHMYAAGAAIYLTGLQKTYLDLSYYRTYDYSDVARDIMGASFKQYLFDSVKLYANARYDLTAQVFNEVLAGAKYFPTLNVMLTAEHYESYPTFDTTSIYSVFAVNQFKDNVLRAEYTATAWLDLSVGGSWQSYGDGAEAKQYEVGFRLRPTPNAAVGLFHDKRWGYPGDLSGYKLYGEYNSIGKWKVAAGMDYDAYARDDMTGQETAKKYWAAGRYTFAKNMSASIRVEDNVNVNYSRDMQGRMTFDYDF